jgi:hypothetical protein
MKLNKKQIYVLWISCTLFAPFSYALHIKIANYNEITENIANDKTSLMMEHWRFKSDSDSGQSIDEDSKAEMQTMDEDTKLKNKLKNTRREIVMALLRLFCLISFTTLSLVFFKEEK